MKTKLIIIFLFFIPQVILPQGNKLENIKGEWEILQDESKFTFEIKNTWIFTVEGTVGGINGSIDFSQFDEKGFISLSLDVNTLDAGNDMRTRHLKTEDFFHVEKYPHIKFNGGNVEEINSSKNKYEVTGQLTIRDVTESKKIPVRFMGFTDNEKSKMLFTGSVKVNRFTYNLDFRGSPMGKEATVFYDIVAKKKE